MENLTEFITSINFNTPIYFLLAIGLVLFLIFIPLPDNQKRFETDLHCYNDKITFKKSKNWIMMIPIIAVSMLLTGVFSDPNIIKRPIINVYGYPTMIVMDISGSMDVGYIPALVGGSSNYESMDELSHKTTNFGQAYIVFKSLIERETDINFGLTLFSTENYIARYFINKDELFKDIFENEKEILDISQGTDITAALKKARVFLTNNIWGDDKSIILISDLDVYGTDWTQLVVEMNKVTADSIKLYVIGIGAGINKQNEIPPLAGITVVNMNDKDGIDWICADISSKQMNIIREEEGYLEKSAIPYLIISALAVLVLCLILSATRFLKIP